MSRFYGDFDPASTATTVTGSVNTSFTSVYMPGDTSIADESGTQTLTTGGSPTISSLNQFGGGSIALLSSADYIQFNNASNSLVFSSAFSIEFWSYPTGTGLDVILYFSDPDNLTHGIGIYARVSSNSWTYRTSTDTGGSAFNTGDVTFGTCSTNEWQHVSICRTSDNVVRGFVNGVFGTAVTIAGTFRNDGNYGISRQKYASQRYQGYIDDLVILKDHALRTTSANFSVPTQANGGGIDNRVTDTRAHSHIWNYRDVYDARSADTWPGHAFSLAWDTTTAGSDVLITNGNMTVTIDDTSDDWPNNSAISVESHSSGKVYYEATIAGSAHSGYLRVGVVQNQGSATLIEIQSDRMSTWDGNAPAHANKSENRSEVNGSQIEDGSQTHSSGDVFMYALDIDNARAYFGRNGSFDLSFDPVNGTGGYNIASLSGYNSTDPWHILFQSLRSDQGVVTLRTAGEAQYLPSGYSYWGTI